MPTLYQGVAYIKYYKAHRQSYRPDMRPAVCIVILGVILASCFVNAKLTSIQDDSVAWPAVCMLLILFWASTELLVRITDYLETRGTVEGILEITQDKIIFQPNHGTNIYFSAVEFFGQNTYLFHWREKTSELIMFNSAVDITDLRTTTKSGVAIFSEDTELLGFLNSIGVTVDTVGKPA